MSDPRATEPCETGCGARLPADVEHTPIRCRTLRAIRADAEQKIPRAHIDVDLEPDSASDNPVYVIRVQWPGHPSRRVAKAASAHELHTSSAAIERFVHEVWEMTLIVAGDLSNEPTP